MTRYVLRRLLHLLPVWIGISLLAFALMEVVPGDPAVIILQRQTGDPPPAAAVQRLREELHLDEPAPLRYGRWVTAALTGDLGTSYRTGGPVLRELVDRFPATAALAVAAVLLALLAALPLGAAAALRREKLVDHVSRGGSLLGASLPSFWLAYLLILAFPLGLGLLPVAGAGSAGHLVLPAVTLAVGLTARLSRLTRAGVLEELEQDYVLAARARGLGRGEAALRHCLPNAASAILTVAVLGLGHLMAGAVVVETIFAWPGIGKLVIDAIHDRDYPMIQGFVLFSGTVFLALHFLADVAYARMDPRVRLDAEAEGLSGGAA